MGAARDVKMIVMARALFLSLRMIAHITLRCDIGHRSHCSDWVHDCERSRSKPLLVPGVRSTVCLLHFRETLTVLHLA
jgi:hypothetical protein